MTLVRRVARPMLAAMFVAGGLDQLKHPGRKVDTARSLVEQVGPTLGLPDDPELLQDLVLAAVNEGLRSSQEMAANKMGGLTGGMDLGGLGLPGF